MSHKHLCNIYCEQHLMILVIFVQFLFVIGSYLYFDKFSSLLVQSDD